MACLEIMAYGMTQKIDSNAPNNPVNIYLMRFRVGVSESGLACADVKHPKSEQRICSAFGGVQQLEVPAIPLVDAAERDAGLEADDKDAPE